MTLDHITAICALAAKHGIELDPATMTLNEAGLDFRVGIGRGTDGLTWVLRVPRRAELEAQIESEARILDFVAPRLSAAVPDWRVRSADLVAYPAVAGEPGLTIDSSGALHWRLDLTSLRYAERFGVLLAELHRIDVERARAAGIPFEAPDEVRERWRREIALVAGEFEVAPHLTRRWQAWLDDDSYWPPWSVFTHGELYPAHVLIDPEDSITGVLDWTTAKVSDPGRDFVFQRGMSSPELFERTVEAYAGAGGCVWPRLADHAAELWAASPVAYGLFAMQTGDDVHRAAAQAQLNPPA